MTVRHERMAQVCSAAARAVRRAYIPPMSGFRVAALSRVMIAACAAPPPTPESVVAGAAQQSGTDALLIAVSAVDDRVVWASGQGGTWLRTLDGGAHWQSGRVPGADSLQFRDV